MNRALSCEVKEVILNTDWLCTPSIIDFGSFLTQKNLQNGALNCEKNKYIYIKYVNQGMIQLTSALNYTLRSLQLTKSSLKNNGSD